MYLPGANAVLFVAVDLEAGVRYRLVLQQIPTGQRHIVMAGSVAGGVSERSARPSPLYMNATEPTLYTTSFNLARPEYSAGPPRA